MNRLKTIGNHLVERFPYIAIYTLAAFLIMLVAREMYRVLAPDSWYLSYSTFDVQSVPESVDIPYKTCRNRTGTYDLAGGARSIFKIKDANNPESDEIIATISYPKDGSTTNRNCINGFVNKVRRGDKLVNVLTLPAGNYIAENKVKFKINGLGTLGLPKQYDKEVSIKSNVFTISERPLTSDEIIKRIEELEAEIKVLRDSLNKPVVQTKSNAQNTESLSLNKTQNNLNSTSATNSSNSDINNQNNTSTNNSLLDLPSKLLEGLGNIL